MPEKKFILSGPVHSGKTSFLKNWISKTDNVDGLLSPVENGKRCFEHISTRSIFAMEADQGDQDVLAIGKYRFSKAAFCRANDILLKTLELSPSWLVVDEIGPLELRTTGLFDALQAILNSETTCNQIFVIRDKILDEAIAFFNLKDYQIITISDHAILV